MHIYRIGNSSELFFTIVKPEQCTSTIITLSSSLGLFIKIFVQNNINSSRYCFVQQVESAPSILEKWPAKTF